MNSKFKVIPLILCLSALYPAVGMTQLKYQLVIPAAGLKTTFLKSAALSSNTLAFGAVPLGQSAAQQVLLSNTGEAALALTPHQITGSAFSASTNCGATLEVGQSCLTSVTFSPPARGAFEGGLDFVSSADNSPLAVALSGSGAMGEGSLTANTASNFGSVLVGATATREFTFSNVGELAAGNTYASVSGSAYSLTSSTCGTVGSRVAVSAGGSCLMTVQFAPTVGGDLTGGLKVVSDAVGSPYSLALSGTGLQAVGSFPTGTVTDFGTVALNGSKTLQLTYQNTGNAPASGVYAEVAGPGVAMTSNTCGVTGSRTTLSNAAGSNTCSIGVTWTPSSTGSLSNARVTVTSDAAGSPTIATLTGTSVAMAAGTLTPSTSGSYDFGTILQGYPASRVFTFTNSGGAPATNTYASVTGAGVAITANTCGVTGSRVTVSNNAGSNTCSVTVAWNPSTAGSLSDASVTVTSSAANSPSTVALAGTAVNEGTLSNVKTFDYTGAIDSSWVAPRSGFYIVEVTGAGGGATKGWSGYKSKGAFMKCSVNINAGTTLKVLVGQQGLAVFSAGGGGGGTFVATADNVPLAVAGGGGGTQIYSGGGDGLTTNSGTGGGSVVGFSGTANTGAGFAGDGYLAKSFVNGGASGDASRGGFGGGGGAGGGGGGYTGGNVVSGYSNQNPGAGGGSFCANGVISAGLAPLAGANGSVTIRY